MRSDLIFGEANHINAGGSISSVVSFVVRCSFITYVWSTTADSTLHCVTEYLSQNFILDALIIKIVAKTHTAMAKE
jgi:hypothetical protein